ncbi:hypothetical protein BX600DRAFT_238575 [Xylariales sp. PMI_506]|nr:hypothetical protein BX600DRAFT_238575 [Xylariales sp. PMI_506]
MEEAHDDVPPPPYSETDIYSPTGHSPIPPHLSPRNNIADDASIAPSSSHSNIIYTPPDTPRESQASQAEQSEDYHTTASAQVYFDSRAVSSGLLISPSLVHQIRVPDDPAPEDFPYPGWAPDRETTEQDWRTFINYLIPDYADKANALIIDRKLHAEGDAESSSRTATEAQLEHLKTSSQRKRFEDTVKEWNAGFFKPRGIAIRLDQNSEPRIPGAWDRAFDTQPNALGIDNPALSGPVTGESSQNNQGWRGLLGSHLGMEASGRSFRLGPIKIDGDRVAIGKSFEADSRGVRWNGKDITENWNSPGGTRGFGPSNTWGGGFDHGQGWGHRWEHRRGGGFGRRRSNSVSSHSSGASSSSGSSVSSIGSLPDYDDLKTQQVPVAKNIILSWINHPDHPITKAELKHARTEIKAAKSLSPPGGSGENVKRELKSLMDQFKSLKKTQKEMRKQAKKAKKEQRKANRRARREKRKGKRADRRDWRSGRRSEQDADGHVRRGGFPGPRFMGPPMHVLHNQNFPTLPTVNAQTPPPGLPGFGLGRYGPGGPSPGPWGRGGGHHVPQHPGHTSNPWFPHPPGAWPWQDHTAAQAHAQQYAANTRAMAHEEAAQAVAQAHIDTETARQQAEVTAQQARDLARQAAQNEPSPHSASAAKYEAVKQLEVSLYANIEALQGLERGIQEEGIQAAKAGQGDSKTQTQSQVAMQKAAEQLELEIEKLAQKVETLRVEADEEFAREIERSESLAA